jgi:hypothetical protein
LLHKGNNNRKGYPSGGWVTRLGEYSQANCI